MNNGFFAGAIAKSPTLREGGKTPVCHFTLILNEYAGKDQGGDDKERKVAIPFTAFAGMGKAIAEHAMVGDQLIIQYRVANNNHEQDGQMEYGFSFIVDGFTFGAPGKLKREKLAHANG
jgi:single-strand DNA-binding protein